MQETPTVSYPPLKGADFVQRVLAPISLDTLFLLDASGWSSDRLFRLMVDKMNGVENANGANGPTPERAPVYQDFKRAALLLRQLELEHLVSDATHQNQPVLFFEPEARDRAEYLELTGILGLNPNKLIFPVTVAARGGSADSINLSLRSFAGVMYFLSQSVQVPEEDIAAGRVTVTRVDRSTGSSSPKACWQSSPVPNDRRTPQLPLTTATAGSTLTIQTWSQSPLFHCWARCISFRPAMPRVLFRC